MDINKISASIKIAACICAKDGLISQAEEEMMFQIISERLPTYKIAKFNVVIDEFFDSTDQIEDYLKAITDPETCRFTLHLAEVSASVDGLDIRENIALQKAYLIWGMDAS